MLTPNTDSMAVHHLFVFLTFSTKRPIMHCNDRMAAEEHHRHVTSLLVCIHPGSLLFSDIDTVEMHKKHKTPLQVHPIFLNTADFDNFFV